MRFAAFLALSLVALGAAARAETPASTACIIAAGRQLLPGLSVQSAVTVKAARFEAKDKSAVADAIGEELTFDKSADTLLRAMGPFTAGLSEELRSARASGSYSQVKSIISAFVAKNATESGVVTFDLVAFGQPATYVSSCAAAPGALYATPPILK